MAAHSHNGFGRFCGLAFLYVCFVFGLGRHTHIHAQTINRVSDISIRNVGFGIFVVDGGVPSGQLQDTTLYLQEFIVDLSWEWKSPSGQSYVFDIVIEDTSVLGFEINIPLSGNLSVVYEPFTTHFDCLDHGSSLMSVALTFAPPTVQMPILRFRKYCSSPCVEPTTCFGHGDFVVLSDGTNACECASGYQTACCTVGLFVDKSEICLGESVTLSYDSANAKSTDLIYLGLPLPGRNDSVPWNINQITQRSLQGSSWVSERRDISGTLVVGTDLNSNTGSLQFSIFTTTYGLWSVSYAATEGIRDRYWAVTSFNVLPASDPICLQRAAGPGVDVSALSFQLTCAHGTWNTTTKICQCSEGFFGLQCEHGCAPLAQIYFNSGYVNNDAAGARIYANSRCSWLITPISPNQDLALAGPVRPTAGIMMKFSFFNTWSNFLDDSGDTVVVSDGNGTIYRTLNGRYPFVESFVVVGGSVLVEFSTTSWAPSWAQGNATREAGFTFSYNAMECLSGSEAPQTGTCITCPAQTLVGPQGYLEPSRSTSFLCQGCSATSFTLNEGVEVLSGCRVCSTAVVRPVQPDFMSCVPDWPPPSVDVSETAMATGLAILGVMMAVLLASVVAACRLHYRGDRVIHQGNPTALYIIAFACTLLIVAAGAIILPQTALLCNLKLWFLVGGAQLLLCAFAWQVYRMQALIIDNTPLSHPVSEDIYSETGELPGDAASRAAAASAAPVPSSPSLSARPPELELKKADSPQHSLIDDSSSSSPPVSRVGDEDMVASSPRGTSTTAPKPMEKKKALSVPRVAPMVTLRPYQTYTNKIAATVILLLPCLFDLAVVIIFWNVTPLTILSKHRKECILPSDPALSAGAVTMMVVLGLSKLPLFVYNCVIWTRLSRLPVHVNEARFVGLIMADSLLVALICEAVVQGFGSSLADDGIAALIQCFSVVWVLAFAMAMTFGHRLTAVYADKSKSSAYTRAVKKRQADLSTQLSKSAKDGTTEAAQLIASSEAVLVRLQQQLDSQHMELEEKKSRADQLRVASFFVQKMLDNPTEMMRLMPRASSKSTLQ